jgi:hypothetical protein
MHALAEPALRIKTVEIAKCSRLRRNGGFIRSAGAATAKSDFGHLSNKCSKNGLGKPFFCG